MDSIISTFHIDWKIIVAQAFNFAVVFVVLYIFALKPLSKLMKERSEKISQGINDAKESAILIEKVRKEGEEIIVKAKAEANIFFQNSKKEAEAKSLERIEQAKNESALIIESARKTMEADKAKLVDDAKNEIAGLAMLAAKKIMAEENK